MPRPLRASLVALVLIALAACGRDGALSDPAALDPAAKSVCTGDVADILADIYSGGLLNSRLGRCANLQRQYTLGEVLAATGMVHDMIDDVLADAAAGLLMDPSEGTLEEALEDLIAALLAEVDLTADPGGIVVETVDETGGQVVTPNALSALEFDPGDLSGETIVSVIQLPGPAMPMGCPFAFETEHDCYPHFFDWSVTPAGNLLDDVIGGLCVVDTGPNAPPNETVANRLRVSSEDPLNPGTLIFWPLAEAPSGVQCEPVITSGWQKELFAALGPLEHLFRVTPAYANPGKLGASIVSFSPFAAADPVTDNVLIDCAEGTLGDLLFRGFYSLSWPGTTLEAVDMFFGADSAGTHSIELAVRLDSYGGPLIAADTISVSLGGLVETMGTFTFPSTPIATGDTVAFSLAHVAGPTGPGDDVFYSVPGDGNPACPITQTNGTTPPLDSFRREGIKATFYGAP